MKKITLLLSILLTFTSCDEIQLEKALEGSGLLNQSNVSLESQDITRTDLRLYSKHFIYLDYNEQSSNQATSCQILNLENITKTKNCECYRGRCKVQVRGYPGYSGSAKFDYVVVNDNGSSNMATAHLNIMPSQAFTSIWRIENDGDSTTLPLRSGFNYNFTVDWGDGSPSSTVTSSSDPNATHVYATAGDYTITINGMMESLRLTAGTGCSQLLEISELGDMGWTDLSVSFAGASLCIIRKIKGGNTKNVTNISSAFSSLMNAEIDLRSWDTSKVEDMGYMLNGTRNILFYAGAMSTESLDLNASSHPFRYFCQSCHDNVMHVGDMDVSNVDRMYSFLQRGTGNTFHGIEYWDTRGLTSMNYMFGGAYSCPPSGISAWDVSNVTDMTSAFSNTYCAGYLDLSSWDTSSVEVMDYMFSYSRAIDVNTSGWNTSNVTSMRSMFNNAHSANPDVSNWDVSNVTNISYMFDEAYAARPDVSNWNTSNMTDISWAFSRMNVFELDVSNWDTSNVEYFSSFIFESYELRPDISNWDLSSIAYSSFSIINNFHQIIDDDVYSDFLINMAANHASLGLTIDFYGHVYRADAAAARQILIDNGWTITDAGQEF